MKKKERYAVRRTSRASHHHRLLLNAFLLCLLLYLEKTFFILLEINIFIIKCILFGFFPFFRILAVKKVESHPVRFQREMFLQGKQFMN